jgi:isochorismate hydrolase
MVWNICRLIRGARTLSIETRFTEQYPRGLGRTDRSILASLGFAEDNPIAAHEASEKLMFSCRECTALLDHLASRNIHRILAVGIEAHVCVLQSVLDLMSEGFDVYVCVDAIGSRAAYDREIAMRRMELAGATLVTTEMTLFEWCEIAGTPEFKLISQLVREQFSQ